MNRYPLWRYALLTILIVLGVIYALPNIFGDDPAVQISIRDSLPFPDGIEKTVTQLLDSQRIAYRGLERQDNSYVLRFSDPQQQFKAQNVLQTLGNDYSVALTLAPRTPKWLLDIGAQPMKLGLDLRGGVHFLLSVDVADMIKTRQMADKRAIATMLREQKLRYASIRDAKNAAFTLGFRSESQRTQAFEYLRKQFPDYVFVSSQTKAGQFQLTAKMTENAVLQLRQYAMEQNLAILRARVREMQIDEAIIQQQGANQISVDLPGIQDMASAKSLIGKMVTIRLQLQDVDKDAAAIAKSGAVPFGTQLFRDERGLPVLLKDSVILTGSSIIGARADVDENGRPAVSIQIGGAAVSNFNRITAANIGKPLAVVYVENQEQKSLVDGKVVTNNVKIEKVINIATINSALGNRFQITGLSSMQYANNLALLLRSGAYSARMNYVEERVVGPSLGKQNIAMGVHSLEIGSALVILFMVFYYRLFGLVADAALLLNIVFIVAILSIMHSTLTLPGIAAIVLTVGMAVDANVLINERIREELRNGVSPQASIHAGYARAFSTIVDANVTTLIIAVILLTVPSNTVQNFAVTLIVGLLTSMVTAIFFTRAIINLIYGKRAVKQLSLGIKV